MGADFCNTPFGRHCRSLGRVAVGMMAQQSARLMGAKRVIAIDRYPERLQMARETMDYTKVDSVLEPDSGTTNIRNTSSKHWQRWWAREPLPCAVRAGRIGPPEGDAGDPHAAGGDRNLDDGAMAGCEGALTARPAGALQIVARGVKADVA
ncbi:hypothetical protein J2126_003653 [Xanthobacter flavus]|nr:hypothetical protein [Xanthobacter flavus]